MQLSYNVDPSPGVVGALAEAGAKVVHARAANGTVRPGQYVVINGDECNHPAAEPTPETRGGIALRNPYKQNDGVYADGEMVDICVDGMVWCASENAASQNTKVFVRCVAGAGEELGALRTDADTADAFYIPGIFFRTAGTALVKVEVNHESEVS